MPNYFDQIEAYLTGQLSKEEAFSFEQEVAKNKSLANELALQKLEHDSMELLLEKQLQSNMSNWDNNPPANPFLEEAAPKVVSLKRRNLWPWLVAATVVGVLIIAGVQFFIGKTETEPIIVEDKQPTKKSVDPAKQEETPLKETEQVAEQPNTSPERPEAIQREVPKKGNGYLALATSTYQAPNSFSSTIRSGDEPSEASVLDQAAKAYDEGNFQQALELLGPAETTDQSEERYLRAHTYFQLKNYALAAKDFQLIASDEFMPNYQEARWYLLLTYLAQLPGAEESFQTLAQELAADEYFSYQKEAKALLEKVNKLN